MDIGITTKITTMKQKNTIQEKNFKRVVKVHTMLHVKMVG